MTGPDPLEHAWWLASRAAGVVALLAITLSVGIGLAMAGRVSRRPPLARTLMGLHQQTALIGLVAIAVHGITLLGDPFMHPSLPDLAVPGRIEHARLWTALGVTGGWLAAILGLSYWLRDRIGPARWRTLHRATILVYVLSVAHTLGAGSDASQPWMRALLLATGAPILFLFIVRVLPAATGGDGGGFRRFRVAEVTPESSDVVSLGLEPADGRPRPPHRPGQFVPLRIDGLVRSYSLSSAGAHRISVKRDGAVSTRLHALSVGDSVELGDPAGTFVLDEAGDGPVVLLSAGVGATPVLAMLHALAPTGRDVWWVHGARSPAEHAFRAEVEALAPRVHVRYSATDGRWSAEDVLALGAPLDADYYLCGTTAFVQEMAAGLREAGVERIRSEAFGGTRPPAPAVAFSRSGITARWDEGFASLLELAEAHDVPAASGCRMGACHGCRATVLDGEVRHDPAPASPPPPGSALLCCARPAGDVVLEA